MEKVVRKFASFQEAEQADRDYYRSLTPEERLEIAFELWWRYYCPGEQNPPRLERVCRVIQREER